MYGNDCNLTEFVVNYPGMSKNGGVSCEKNLCVAADGADFMRMREDR